MEIGVGLSVGEVAVRQQRGATGPGAGVDNLLLEDGSNILLEDGTSVLLLE